MSGQGLLLYSSVGDQVVVVMGRHQFSLGVVYTVIMRNGARLALN